MGQVIGLTGEPCAGKSTVAGIFTACGASVIDVDKVGHEVLKTARVRSELRTIFGAEISPSAGEVDRAKLGALVFADPQALRQLEGLVHPAMVASIKAQIGELRDEVLVLDAAVLLRMRLERICDQVILMTAPQEIRCSRALARGWSEENLKSRSERLKKEIITYQEQSGFAYTIVNNGVINKLTRTTRGIWKELRNGK